MKKGELKLNKWNIKLGLIYNYDSRFYFFHFGIFKIISFPQEGFIFTKENYKGFWFRKDIYWYGFELTN